MDGDYWRNVREQTAREQQIATTAYQQGLNAGVGISSNYQAGYQAGFSEAQRREWILWFAVVILGVFVFLGVGSILQAINALVHPTQCSGERKSDEH